MDTAITNARSQMAKIIEVIKTDLSTVRTGRATPSLVENIVISAYGGSAKMKVVELAQKKPGEQSSSVRERVIIARERQLKRFSIHKKNLFSNAGMQSKEIREFCKIDSAGEELLKMAMTKLGLSARAYDRILKVSRTIADLAGSAEIGTEHLSEAIQYRSLDRNLWM